MLTLLYQMVVRVHDDGKPVRSAEATVTITVKRNKYLPTFTEISDQQMVSENTKNGTGVLTITATDKDLQEAINYELVGVAPAPSYFSVGRTTGYIYVIKNLKEDRALTYTVGMHACTRMSVLCACVCMRMYVCAYMRVCRHLCIHVDIVPLHIL